MGSRDGIEVFAGGVDDDEGDSSADSEMPEKSDFGSVLIECGFNEVQLSWWHVVDQRPKSFSANAKAARVMMVGAYHAAVWAAKWLYEPSRNVANFVFVRKVGTC